MSPARRTVLSLGLLGVLSFRALAARAQPENPVAATLRRIEAARSQVQTLEADFDQERTMGLFAQMLRARGRLVVQRPDRIRWEIVTPDPGTFIVANGRVSYRVGNSTATATQAQVGALGAVLGDLAAFLGGPLVPLLRRYRMEVAQRPDHSLVLTAVPLEPSVARTVSRVQLEFRPDLRAIQSIAIEEPGGDRTSIRVQNVRINSGRVDARAFTL